MNPRLRRNKLSREHRCKRSKDKLKQFEEATGHNAGKSEFGSPTAEELVVDLHKLETLEEDVSLSICMALHQEQSLQQDWNTLKLLVDSIGLLENNAPISIIQSQTKQAIFDQIYVLSKLAHLKYRHLLC